MVGSDRRRKRWWFAPRYGLRFLLLLMTFAACLLALDLKRAHERERLIRQLTELGGSYKTAARPYIPVELREFLRGSQTYVIEEVELGGMLAPGQFHPIIHGERLEVIDVGTLRQLLSLPTMSEVRTLKLSGTAVSDALIDDLSKLSGLQTVEFFRTAVTEEGAERLRLAIPDCTVKWRSFPPFSVRRGWRNTSDNGPQVVEFSHQNLLRFLGDISIFTRAQEGDHEAVRMLLRRIGEAPWSEVSALREQLSSVKSRANLHLLREGLRDGNPTVRRFLIASLDSDARLLGTALRDPEVDVRLEALYRIPMLQRQQALRLLHTALENESSEVREMALRQMEELNALAIEEVICLVTADPSPQVRWKAVDILEQFEDERAVDALIVALEDQAPFVRSAAARSLGARGDKRAIEALESALEDADANVQARARESLQELSLDGQ